MVTGIDSFKEWFNGSEEQYAIIGGTACDILMTEDGLDFRATNDIDLILIIEAVDAYFGKKFWEYIKKLSPNHRICGCLCGQYCGKHPAGADYRWRGRSHLHGPILNYIFCYAFHLVKQVFPYEVGDGEILSHYTSVPCLWMLSFAKSPSDSVAPAV